MPFAILQEFLDLSSDMYILLDRVDRIGGDAYDFHELTGVTAQRL